MVVTAPVAESSTTPALEAGVTTVKTELLVVAGTPSTMSFASTLAIGVEAVPAVALAVSGRPATKVN